eukprot:6331448-Alexandrium_andersonii.AAC.1
MCLRGHEAEGEQHFSVASFDVQHFRARPVAARAVQKQDRKQARVDKGLSLIHISEPTRLALI